MMKKIKLNKDWYFYLAFILFFIFGVFFGNSLKDEFIPKSSSIISLTLLDIFFHNVKIAIFISTTPFISVPILLINSLTLGMSVSLSFSLHGLRDSIFLLSHVPIELVCWFMTFNISSYLHSIYLKKEKVNAQRIFRKYFILLSVYFLAAIIEFMIIKIKL